MDYKFNNSSAKEREEFLKFLEIPKNLIKDGDSENNRDYC